MVSSSISRVVYMSCLADCSMCSRVALKKYVKANNKINLTDSMFDSLFNRALKAGVDKGIFAQPKGTYRIPHAGLAHILTLSQVVLEEPSWPRRSQSQLLSPSPINLRPRRRRRSLLSRRLQAPQRRQPPLSQRPLSPRHLLSLRLRRRRSPRHRRLLLPRLRRPLHQRL